MKKIVLPLSSREQFRSKRGFVLACIGSAVGMGNIWMFPIRVHQFGGAAFLIPYFLFTILIGYTGIVGEMSFGRAFRSGPLGAFTKASYNNGKKFYRYFGIIPVIGSLGIAIGYSVVVAWILRFFIGSLTGSVFDATDTSAYFGAIAGSFGSAIWHISAIFLCFLIMSFGIQKGIEKVNEVMMPTFFVLFLILAIRIFFISGAQEGYRFLFHADFSKLRDINAWIYALGQSFFSLSLAGSGTVVYGSYLRDTEDATASAKYTATFDTCAAMLAALVIIPAIYAYQVRTQGGPPLLFITMPEIFKNMFGGRLFSTVFFLAVFFAGMTSLINLYETTVEMLQTQFALPRKIAVAIVMAIGLFVGLFIENAAILSTWMDIVSIYMIPLGALLAGICFAWICKKDFVIREISKGRTYAISNFFYYHYKWIYCGVTLLIYLLGFFQGSIG